MRRKTLFVLIVGTLLLCLGSAYGFENEPEGFRGLKWGDPPTGDMQFLQEREAGQRGYSRYDEKLKMGGVPLYSIVYLFYGQPEKFYIVLLYFEDEDNYETLKTICRGKFGKETMKGLDSLTWESQMTIVRLEYDSIEDYGGLSLASTPLLQEYTKIKEKKQLGEAEKDW